MKKPKLPRKKVAKKVVQEKPKITADRHKYKVEEGKKVYTFRNKQDVSKNLKITNKKISKILNGEVEDKYKISLI